MEIVCSSRRELMVPKGHLLTLFNVPVLKLVLSNECVKFEVKIVYLLE